MQVPEVADDDLELESVRPKRRELTPKQQTWIAAYVTNGRNARQASIAAGTPPISAGQRGYENLRNPLILDAIRAAAGDIIKTRLPELVDSIMDLALDPKTPPTARVSAFRELADRGGMHVPKGPMVQINNGVTDVKAQAQALIAEIWTERNTREARAERTHAYVAQLVDSRKSSIADGMSDVIDNDQPTSDGQRLEPGRGGDQVQGPIAGAYPIPPSPSERLSSAEDLGFDALLAWRGCVGRLGGVIVADMEADDGAV